MMQRKLIILCCIVVANVFCFITPAAATNCRDYVKELGFWLSRPSDNNGSCRMQNHGEYPPESVPFSKREGLEHCYRKGRVAVEYLWREGRRVRGTVRLWGDSKAMLTYKDTYTVSGTVQVMKEDKLFCEIPVVSNVLTGIVREYYPDGKLAEGFCLKNGKSEKGMVAFTQDGSLKQFECSEKPVFPGDKERCGFYGKPVTISFTGDTTSATTTLTHLNGNVLEKTVLHSNGYKDILKYPAPGKDSVHQEKYYPNGKLHSSLTLENNVAEGEAKEFYEDGQLSAVAVFKKGIAEEVHSYYQNGRSRFRAVLIPGKNLCKVTLYNQAGKIRKEGTYKAAKEGGVAWSVPHGTVQFYNDGGVLRREGNFFNGASEGMHTFFADGGEKLEVEYKQGIPGEFRKFDRLGNPASHGNIYEDGSVKETLKHFDFI